MRDIANFEDRFDISGIRFYSEDLKRTVCTDFGYRITKGPKGAYVTGTKESHSSKYFNYMMKVASITTIDGESKDLYTQDLVDYIVPGTNQRAAGVIVYDKDRYFYAVQDVYTNIYHPLYQCIICQVFPNIYDRPELVGLKVETVYSKLGREMKPYKPEEKLEKTEKREYAYIDEPIPGITDAPKETPKAVPTEVPKEAAPVTANSQQHVDVYIAPAKVDGAMCWSYKLADKGHELKQKGKFNQTDKNEGYYAAANLVIALSKLNNTADEITIHSAYTPLLQILEEGMLDKWSKNNWMKPDGTAVKNAEVLKQIQANLTRIGGNIKLVYNKNLSLGLTA